MQLIKNFPNVSNVNIEHNKYITDNCGIDRQFDLCWERLEFGKLKKSVIECKDYQNGVSIDRVDALIGKMADIPGVVPIMATCIEVSVYIGRFVFNGLAHPKYAIIRGIGVRCDMSEVIETGFGDGYHPPSLFSPH